MSGGGSSRKAYAFASITVRPLSVSIGPSIWAINPLRAFSKSDRSDRGSDWATVALAAFVASVAVPGLGSG